MISEMLRIVGFHLPPYDCRERCAAAKVFQVEKKLFMFCIFTWPSNFSYFVSYKCLPCCENRDTFDLNMIADCCFPVCGPGHGEGVPVQTLLHSLGQGAEGERGKGDLSSLLWEKQQATSWFIAWCISSLQGERRTKRWWRPVARSHTPWCAPPSQGAFLFRTWNVTDLYLSN